MRAAKAVMGSLVSIALLGVWSTAVAQESEPDLMAPAYFTFDEPVMEPVEAEEDEYSDVFTREVREYVEVGNLVATDPRASGRVTSVVNLNMLEMERAGLAAAAASLWLVNDAGAWSGKSHGLHFVAEDGGAMELTVLNGEGGNEG